MRVNKDLNSRLDHIEHLMNQAAELAFQLRASGYQQEANQALAISSSLNLHHYDLVETEGPVVIRRES